MYVFKRKINYTWLEDLIKSAVAGEMRAIETLYDRFAPTLLSVCFRYTGNREDAEDVLHDSFIKIIKAIGSFSMKSKGSFEGWMTRIAVNTALNFLRSRHREKHFIDIDPIADRINLPDSGQEEDETERYYSVDQETILSLICEMPEGYRTVFNLFVFEEYGHREIASMLGISENTSKSQLSKARMLLRKKMNMIVHTSNSPTYEKA